MNVTGMRPSGLIGKASDLKTALVEKERLYFAGHRHGNVMTKANGVTFESGEASRAACLRSCSAARSAEGAAH
jgi:hypothetical protein